LESNEQVAGKKCGSYAPNKNFKIRRLGKSEKKAPDKPEEYPAIKNTEGRGGTDQAGMASPEV